MKKRALKDKGHRVDGEDDQRQWDTSKKDRGDPETRKFLEPNLSISRKKRGIIPDRDRRDMAEKFTISTRNGRVMKKNQEEVLAGGQARGSRKSS